MIFSIDSPFFSILFCAERTTGIIAQNKKYLLQAGKHEMTILWHIRALLLWRSREDTVAISVYTSYRNWYRKDPKNRDFENSYSATRIIVHIPNRIFLVRFGGISGSFGLAMGILVRLRLAKIRTMARPNSPDMPPKRTKKVRLGIWTNHDTINR